MKRQERMGGFKKLFMIFGLLLIATGGSFAPFTIPPEMSYYEYADTVAIESSENTMTEIEIREEYEQEVKHDRNIGMILVLGLIIVGTVMVTVPFGIKLMFMKGKSNEFVDGFSDSLDHLKLNNIQQENPKSINIGSASTMIRMISGAAPRMSEESLQALTESVKAYLKKYKQ